MRTRFRHRILCPVCHELKSAGWVGAAGALLKVYTHRTPGSTDAAPARCLGSGRLAEPVAALRRAALVAS